MASILGVQVKRRSRKRRLRKKKIELKTNVSTNVIRKYCFVRLRDLATVLYTQNCLASRTENGFVVDSR